MAQAYDVTYKGKAGKDEHEHVPLPGVPQPFHPGETRVFDDRYFATLGVDPKDGGQWLRGLVDWANQGRPEEHQLFAMSRSKAGGKSKGNVSGQASTGTISAPAPVAHPDDSIIPAGIAAPPQE